MQLPLGKIKESTLAELLALLPQNDERVVIPPEIGCDAAGIHYQGKYIAITTDPVTFTSDRIGTYAVNVNINDLACMGCRPLWFTMNILLPEGSTQAQLTTIMRDISRQLTHYSIQAIGGHTEVTKAVNQPIVVGQMIGEAMGKQLLDPRKITQGNRILMWQPTAIEGTALLARERYDALSAYIAPSRLDEMTALLDEPGICVWHIVEKLLGLPGIVALHDPTEGGVATALHELADVSGCGVDVIHNNISVLPQTKQLAEILDIDPLGLLSSGALLVVCEADSESLILQALKDEPIKNIGEFTGSDKRNLLEHDHTTRLPRYCMDEIIRGLNIPLPVSSA